MQPISTRANEPAVRGERLLRPLDRAFTRIGDAIERVIPPAFNPLAQAGTIANTMFLIAVVTGCLLLFWYSTSVHTAWESLETISPLGQLMRSLHRYSSDACMLFILLHALKVIAARRFTGPRWLAWVSGIVMVGLVWLDGWFGVWLIWDTQGAAVATATASAVDWFGLFEEPLARSFITDRAVDTLLFFSVLFAHILIPLAFFIGLLVHVARVNRTQLLVKGRLMWGLVIASLVVLSLIVPVHSGERAAMQALPDQFTANWWYSAPLFLMDRLESGVMWGVVFVGSLILLAVPKLFLRKRPQVSAVVTSRCQGCTQCFQDCPFGAITMMPRTDGKVGKDGPDVSLIDPAKCIGCGICIGSCDPAAIEMPSLDIHEVRRHVDHWFVDAPEGDAATPEDAASTARHLAFLCGRSPALAGLTHDPATGLCPSLPGYRVVALPCAAWLHPVIVERAIRHRAAGVLIASCSHDPSCRLGVEWISSRLQGTREPELRADRVGADRVSHVSPATLSELQQAARDLQTATAGDNAASGAITDANGDNGTGADRPAPAGAARPARTGKRVAVALLLVAVLGVLTIIPGQLPYPVPAVPDAELVVTFRAPGDYADPSESTTERTDLAPHMRRVQGPLARVPVRLRVHIDGREVLAGSYEAGGFHHDRASQALERFPVSPGRHTVEVWIGESADAGEWRHTWSQTVDFPEGQRRVVQFDRDGGFRLD